ncbi:MAG: DNA polymerase IV [Clostridia bacterium]|nr:DNA polymerase IV [Clostridia bacterium]
MIDDPTILHVDINNFFASVSILLNPELKGKPVVVCGDVEKRHGIVLAKSEQAKKAGIKTAETVWSAKQKVPGLILVPPDYKKYSEYSRKVYEIFTRFTPDVESFGMDESWLDVTGCEKLWGNGEQTAQKIKDIIRQETGLTVSIGVSFTKVFAKLGSDMKKPDAITVISRENYKDKVWPLKVSEMLFVGRHTEEKLNAMGIFTIGDLARCGKGELKSRFGKTGEKIHSYANGTDGEKVESYTHIHIPESVGNGTTTVEDVTNIKDASSVIFALSEVIAFRLRAYGLTASGVSLDMRDNTLNSFCRQARFDFASDSAFDIATLAISVLKSNYDFSSRPPLRTITVAAGGLKSRENVQQSLFDEEIYKNSKLESSIDELRRKYGFGVLRRGVTINSVFSCDAREIEDEFIPFGKTISPSTDDN